MKQIELNPSKIVVRGPKVDGGYTITLEIGEYEQAKVAEVIMLPQQQTFKVTIEPWESWAGNQTS